MRTKATPSRYEAARDLQAAAIRAQEAAARRESYNHSRNRRTFPVSRVLRWAGVALAAAAVFSAFAYGI